MADNSNQNYLEVVANAFSTASAWRMATFTLGGVVAVLAFALIHMAQNQTMVLVPYDLATAKGNMTIPLNGGIKGTSQEYVANIALADLGLILNYTPENIDTQTRRFLNRLTDSLYGDQQLKLLAQAEDQKKQGFTQSFFPSDVSVKADGSEAQIKGTQIRYQAGRESLRNSVTYVITYKVSKGYLHVADLQQLQK